MNNLKLQYRLLDAGSEQTNVTHEALAYMEEMEIKIQHLQKQLGIAEEAELELGRACSAQRAETQKWMSRALALFYQGRVDHVKVGDLQEASKKIELMLLHNPKVDT